MKRSDRRLLFVALALGSAAFVACSSSSSSGNGSGDDTSSPDASNGTDATIGGDAATTNDGSTTHDGGPSGTDGSVSTKDASTVGEGGPGADCSFNHDCIAADRCECDESTGCFCEAGARGTGKNGIDRCNTGDDCTSSLCVEGPDGGSFCSDECGSAADCTGALPKCSDIAFVGMICIRNP